MGNNRVKITQLNFSLALIDKIAHNCTGRLKEEAARRLYSSYSLHRCSDDRRSRRASYTFGELAKGAGYRQRRKRA